MSKVSNVMCVVALFVMVFLGAQVTAQSKCDYMLNLLSPCLHEYKKPTPSADCCINAREHVPCFCGYMMNPDFRRVFDRIQIRRVAGMCGVTFPPC
ncbi:Tracheary Element Differentiation-related 4 [Hibiscus trionum]|uniref:Tracheary Element Differentiation-related 4 n=1 Tax=Hibiscus trionum TaxID=183268 RepID=A0A9W7MDJ7_HIBTR|nr:Tracheary Element Differentiation-related 4 [Hibiscus trionum]